MTEKNLIGKIRELRQIKPKRDWVILTKSQILGKEFIQPRVLNIFPGFRVGLAGAVIVSILFGIFTLAQNSLPGDLLYPIKKITERSRAVFISEEKLPKYNLELANKRLEELNEIIQTQRAQRLAPAISEFQAQAREAAKNLPEIKEIEKIVAPANKLEENKRKVEEVLAIRIETEELDNALAQLVEREIKDLEGRTLTEEQQKLLTEAKELYEAGNYGQALEKLLILSQYYSTSGVE